MMLTRLKVFHKMQDFSLPFSTLARVVDSGYFKCGREKFSLQILLEYCQDMNPAYS